MNGIQTGARGVRLNEYSKWVKHCIDTNGATLSAISISAAEIETRETAQCAANCWTERSHMSKRCFDRRMQAAWDIADRQTDYSNVNGRAVKCRYVRERMTKVDTVHSLCQIRTSRTATSGRSESSERVPSNCHTCTCYLPGGRRLITTQTIYDSAGAE